MGYNKNMFLDILGEILESLWMLLMAEEITLIKSDVLNILGVVGIALLTLMVSVAVAIFSDKKHGIGEGNGNYEILDRNAFLEHIVQAQRVLPYLVLIYAPLVFLGNFPRSPLFSQVLALTIWCLGVWGMVRILMKSYYWMKGDRDKLRKEYLRILKDLKELEGSPKLFCSVWDIEGRHDYQEKEFFKIFSSTIDKLLESNANSIGVVSKLVQDFNKHINKRSMIFLVAFDEVLPKILAWHFLVWERRHKNSYDDDVLMFYLGAEDNLSSILEQVQKRALKRTEMFSLFCKLKSHIETCEANSSEKESGETYIESVMAGFFNRFLGNIQTNRDIQGNFPSKWEITEKNIKCSKEQVAIVLFKEFMPWARVQILDIKEKGYDSILGDVIRYLFPNVCPIMWAKILAFLMFRRQGGEWIRLLIEQPINFDSIGHGSIDGIVGDDEESEKKQREKMEAEEKTEEKETINLALCLKNLTEGLLNQSIDELNKMKPADSYKERLIDEYVKLFERINERREELKEGTSQ